MEEGREMAKDYSLLLFPQDWGNKGVDPLIGQIHSIKLIFLYVIADVNRVISR
jgi:hypothetical protein